MEPLTVKNSIISPNVLIENYVETHSFRKFSHELLKLNGNCAFPKKYYAMKLDGILVFCTVIHMYNSTVKFCLISSLRNVLAFRFKGVSILIFEAARWNNCLNKDLWLSNYLFRFKNIQKRTNLQVLEQIKRWKNSFFWIKRSRNMQP